MPTYDDAGVAAVSAPDGTKLAYLELGTGDPVVCLPGGPMQDSRYLGDLGGLSARHRLILLGHSGGANLAVLYAAQHPGRVGRLLLITPGLAAVGIDVSAPDRREVATCAKTRCGFRPRPPR